MQLPCIIKMAAARVAVVEYLASSVSGANCTADLTLLRCMQASVCGVQGLMVLECCCWVTLHMQSHLCSVSELPLPARSELQA
jgi:hypothetical protein